MRQVERRGRLDGLVVGVLSRLSSGSKIEREWVCCLVQDSGFSDFCDGTGHRSWMVLYGAAGVMAGLSVQMACTLSGGVVGRCLGLTAVLITQLSKLDPYP
jgi:hypothetical protein